MQISVDSNSFSAAIRGNAQELRDRIELKVKRAATTLLQQLVANTPIQTGQARANWQASIGSADTSFIGGPKSIHPPNSIDYAGYEGRATAVIQGWTSGETIFITNNAPYIQRLNDGYSSQAPAGFVESAVSQAKAELNGI